MGNYWSDSQLSENTNSPGDILEFTTRKYGWRPDLPDHRDYVMTFAEEDIDNDIDCVDLRDRCPPVYDQKSLGSCTSQSIGAAYQYDEMKQGNTDEFMPSRLFIYYNERKIEGTITIDNGASIRDGIKTINTDGVCHESMWPYDINKFADDPTPECYADAKTHKSLKYHRVKQRKAQLKVALQSGYPIVFGITVFESMESSEVEKTGVVPMPGPDEKSLGGHCILLVGYDDDKKQWIFRNSWGESWGDNGYGYLPYKYLSSKSHMASDFWVVETVSKE